MKIIAVDDEHLALMNITNCLKETNIPGVELVNSFSDPAKALDYVTKNHVDLAFLDIEMPKISGIELARSLKQHDSNINVVFVTAYDTYALKAFEADAIGYLLKPYNSVDVEKQIMKAAFIGIKSSLVKNKIYVRTMPRFDIFVNDKAVIFNRSKAKELLAYLVDKRGGAATMEEIISALWEGREYDNKVKILYREAVMNLRRVLEANSLDNIFGISKAQCYVDITKFQCDYYDVLKKEAGTAELFSGQYMSEYPWAEETAAYIERWIKNNK